MFSLGAVGFLFVLHFPPTVDHHVLKVESKLSVGVYVTDLSRMDAAFSLLEQILLHNHKFDKAGLYMDDTALNGWRIN